MGLLGDSWLLAFVTFVIGSVGAFYCWAKYMQSYWKRRGVRSIPAHWFFGNMKDAFLSRIVPGRLLGQLHLTGGDDDVIGIYIFQKPFLLVRNPELIKQMLIKDFHVFPDRLFGTDSKNDVVGSKNLFSIKNPQWKYLRVRMSPAFTSGKLKKLFHLMVETSEAMKEYLEKHVPDKSEKVTTIKVKTISTKYTTDVISSLAFGVKTNSFDEPEPEFFVQCQKTFTGNFFLEMLFMLFFFFPNLPDKLGLPMIARSDKYFKSVFQNSFQTRIKMNAKRGDVIDSLIEIQNEKHEYDDVFEIDDEVLFAQSMIFFIAGRETSITTMTFALYELAKHPEIQERTRKEILEKIQSGGMTYEAVQSMKYLHQVISETLRLYPPAPILDRLTVEDYKLPNSDVIIEKGTPIYIALSGLQRDPKYFDDPTTFDPDRFGDERKGDIVQCTYMPFGEGPRVCIGTRVGMMQTAVGLIPILSNYEVSVNPSYKYGLEKRNVFFSPPKDTVLDFKKLSSESK